MLTASVKTTSTQTCGYWVLCYCINDIMFIPSRLLLMPHALYKSTGIWRENAYALETRERDSTSFLCKSVQNLAETESPGTSASCPRGASTFERTCDRWRACVDKPQGPVCVPGSVPPGDAHKKPRSSNPLAVTGFHFAVGLLLLWPEKKQKDVISNAGCVGRR